MKYDPQKHHRRSIRLKGYDYAQAGAYFITICCQHRQCRFGNIENDQMILNEYGQIAYDEWIALPQRFANCTLDVFQIMPNHMHGIIVLTDTVGAGFTPALDAGVNPDHTHTPTQNDGDEKTGQPRFLGQPQGLPLPTQPLVEQPSTIGDIVGTYKSLVFNQCLDIYKSINQFMGKLWQRNYHEHIIRNEESYMNISNYIIHNPENWKGDKFYGQ
jgi:REP element-mobilizing transposase RayT